MRLRSIIFPATLLLAACGAEEGILVLGIEAPASEPSETLYMFVQARPPEYSFDTQWVRASDLPGEALATAPQRYVIKIGSEREVDAVLVRVRFCRSPRCDADPEDVRAPEAQYEIQRPYCLGELTSYELVIPEVPPPAPAVVPAPILVPGCAVCGCSERREALGCDADCESAPSAPDGG